MLVNILSNCVVSVEVRATLPTTHPLGIITKNVLMKRDFDIIEALAKHNLIGFTLVSTH